MIWHDFVVKIILFTGSLGYLGIFILTAIESSLLPIPSDVLLIPAGVLVAAGTMNFYVLLAFCVAGSVVGALINYYLAYFIGRKGIKKLGLVGEKSLEKAENYFEKRGEVTVFIGRFIPVVRHLISIPAGFARMNLLKFCVYTGLGAGIWSAILIDIGYFLNDTEPLIEKNFELFLTIFVILLVFGLTIYFALKGDKRKTETLKSHQNL